MKLLGKIKVMMVVGVLSILGACSVSVPACVALKTRDGGVSTDKEKEDEIYGESGDDAIAPSATGGSWREGMDIFKDDTNSTNLEDSVKKIINGVLYVVGILAVVMVIIGGVKYTTSGGDQSAVTSAKNTIMYSIVGLVVAILAYAIVNFVIERL